MTRPLLHERFEELRESLPHVELGARPTPVRALAALSGASAGPPVWLKDDGLYGSLWGGNKPRKLEWILADALARRRRKLLTVGGLATNHGLATALYAREHGIRTVLALVEQPRGEHVARQLERLERSGATIYRTRGKYRTMAAVPFLLARHADLRVLRLPYFLTVGGSSPLGCLGFVEAGLELGRQVQARALPQPAYAVVPLGSGGTAAGLALGLRIAGLRTRVVAVLVNDRLELGPPAIARLARRCARLLRARGARLPHDSETVDVRVETEWLGAGYGHGTPAADHARQAALETEGLELDPVYTAKAMAALLDLRERGALGDGPVLYWHTHNAHTVGP